MGGPCLIEAPDGELTNGPICTDNFALSGFEFEGEHYLSAGALPPSLPPCLYSISCPLISTHSAEQAYQALKFPPGEAREIIRAIEPIGDLYAAHGNDCWNAARDVEMEELGLVRDDWESVKVQVMLDVNRAKFAQNESIAAELLLTCQARIVGCGDPKAVTSWVHQGQGHNWMEWNGLIMMIVREELRPQPQSNALL